MLFILMVVFIVLKVVVTGCYGGYLLTAWVYNYTPNLAKAADNYNEDEVREDGKEKTDGASQSRS
jgi:hypothetical protein